MVSNDVMIVVNLLAGVVKKVSNNPFKGPGMNIMRTTIVGVLGDNNMNNGPGIFTKQPIALGVAAALFALSSAPALAEKFQVGDFDITFDSTFAVGASWRIEDRDWNRIGKSNDLRFNWTGYNPVLHTAVPVSYPSTAQTWGAHPGGSYSNNGDAANLNFDPNETFSRIFKGTHELDINKGDHGFFTRFTYYYDFEMMDEERPHERPISGANYEPCHDEKQKDLSCRDIRLLDAYYYGTFYIGADENVLSVKVGEQVLSWGESTLISHGINNNPVDIARLRAPGAELKEAFIPVGMISASYEVSPTFSIEAFLQYDFQETFLPTPGSYFSTNDFAGEGGYYNNVQLSFSGIPDIGMADTVAALNSFYANAAAMGITDPGTLAGLYVGSFPRKTTLRLPGSTGEIKPDDSLDQFGLKMTYFLEEWNATEMSFYFMNYHSNRPLFSGITSDYRGAALQADLQYLANNTITEDNIHNLQAYSKVMIEYPEDIKLYGFSFNTSIGETSVAGEISYRQDEPLQIDDVEILFVGMPQQLAHPDVPDGIRREDLAGISQIDTVAPGQYAKGYITSDTTQIQATFTHLFGPTLGSDNLVMLAEVGYVNIHDMPDESVLRLNGPGTARSGPLVGREGIQKALEDGPETNPFATKDAWGYRLVARAEFNNVFAGVNVTPRMVFSHDVDGITPDPLFLFIEDRKSLSFGLNFDYQSRWSADFAVNRFWGGIGTTNQFADRDYMSFSIKYSI